MLVPIKPRRQVRLNSAREHISTRPRPGSRSDAARLSREDGLIINSIFESCSSQSLDGLFQIACIVKYPNTGRHGPIT